LTKKAVNQIQQNVEIGMTEQDGLELVTQVLNELGCEKLWHPTKFRIGQNTRLSFKDKSNPSSVLQVSDLYFIDIGPVWNNYEGDYGETFVVGSNQDFLKIKKASEEVFKQTKQYFKENKCSGQQLYLFAQKCAEEFGYYLNLKMSGHRIGDFPHHLHYRGSLNEVEQRLLENLWILEIHLLSPDKNYGAFFEDLI
jgi:Xaa-Pro aminopeptidase